MTNDFYLKNKESILKYKKQWLANKGEDYKINVLRPRILKCVKNYYVHNRDKVLAYKKRHNLYKKEVKRLFDMFDSVEYTSNISNA